MRCSRFDRRLIQEILIASEEATGHTSERHVTIDRNAMIERLSRPDIQVDVVTAFPNDWYHVTTAGAMLLNSHVGLGALGYLDQTRFVRQPRIVIEGFIPEMTIRCANRDRFWGEPAAAARMVVDRVEYGHGIHIQTFFPIRYENANDERGRRPLFRGPHANAAQVLDRPIQPCPSWWTVDSNQYDLLADRAYFEHDRGTRHSNSGNASND